MIRNLSLFIFIAVSLSSPVLAEDSVTILSNKSPAYAALFGSPSTVKPVAAAKPSRAISAAEFKALCTHCGSACYQSRIDMRIYGQPLEYYQERKTRQEKSLTEYSLIGTHRFSLGH